MPFTGFILELETPLHIGAGRGGMLLRSHGFVPGHLVSYALAAAIGKASGGQSSDFSQALDSVLQHTRCGPLFIRNPEKQQPFTPRRDRTTIENRYLIARTQVALDVTTGSAIDRALFEVESIAARVPRPQQDEPVQPVQLVGGLWHDATHLAGKSLQDWFHSGLLLGGELKTGLGRVRLATHGWLPKAPHYAQCPAWPVNDHGLRRIQGDLLPGPSLDGTADAPWQPWLGRRFDENRGFGRRFSGAALVRMDARCLTPGDYLPATGEVGLGCWTRVDAPID